MPVAACTQQYLCAFRFCQDWRGPQHADGNKQSPADALQVSICQLSDKVSSPPLVHFHLLNVLQTSRVARSPGGKACSSLLPSVLQPWCQAVHWLQKVTPKPVAAGQCALMRLLRPWHVCCQQSPTGALGTPPFL